MILCAAVISRTHGSGSARIAPFYNFLDTSRPSNTSWNVHLVDHAQKAHWHETYSSEVQLHAEGDAGTANLSQPQKSNCTLHAMRDILYVFTFVPGDDVILLTHWLRHYVSGLGVRPDHLRVAVMAEHATSSVWEEHLRELASVGVGRVTHVGGSDYTDRIRMDAVNEYVATLPRDAWMLFADHDEFYSFSCGIARDLMLQERGCTAVDQRSRQARICAQMYDMLSADGTMAPLRRTPDVSLQYPVRCQVRDAAGGLSKFLGLAGGAFMTSKTALFRVWGERCVAGGNCTEPTGPVLFRNPHSLAHYARRDCDFTHASVAQCGPRAEPRALHPRPARAPHLARGCV